MSAPTHLVSVREFARLDGCDDKLVRRAVKAGKLPISDDGKLDSSLAGSGWRKTNRRAPKGADTAADKSQSVRTVVRTSKMSAPSADETEQASEELFSEEIEGFLDQVLAGTYADTATAERVKENALAAKHLLAARRDAGHLVEIEQAEMVLFETQRSQRDAWMNFPTRIGPLLAAEIGVDADKVVEALTVHVHQQLDDLGEPEADFAAKREG
ncbi:hypothetical protein GGR39_002362 [Novosphingobium fluoreni]|uniref:Elements of external origin n=1 Tax=Novosphingobium fluoreni TaxID=1391222 RepID=A0A7W6C582_9SPHN|nr:hypothetical protein [Novosphingobium fluoreni]MBB3940705.1 hypothetical protein [Novosphingobium fluoreni]